VTWKTVGAVLR